MEMYEIDAVLDSTVKVYEEELQKALRRKARAQELLLKADRDINLISGSLMAVQGIQRQIEQANTLPVSPGPRGPRPTPAEPRSMVTLAGPAPLERQPMPDRQAS